ncbi:cobalamin-dependent protein (plasmid) [Skermanella mucosa]|uniref:cobalamin B12-binding domain-containing protein n=1 Tax=Skermanella mucosa TaxID=1789672 RepID=UPI00192AEA38|nr:cobalamin-dependent protein [Skermanella mucosa]UEM25069.1 cobalamin-dependent protein [Skermanella mucosa]
MGLIFDAGSDPQRRAFAERAVLRQWLRHPEMAQRYGDEGRKRCVEDMQYTLLYLEAATSTGSLELFRNYTEWLRSIFICHNLDVADLAGTLESLLEIFTERGDVLQAEYLTDSLRLMDSMEDVPASRIAENNPHKALATGYLKLLLDQDRQGATDLIINAADTGIPLTDLYLNVLQPCLHEVGRLWTTGQLTIPQEHYVTTATQAILAQLQPYAACRPGNGSGNGRRLLAVSIDGDLHQIGIQVVGDVFTLNGWETTHLGASVPVGDIVRVVRAQKPELLALSVTIAPNLPKAAALIQALRADPECGGTRIIVGGYPFNRCPDLWKRIGADGYARDAAAAVAWADKRFALPGQDPA